MADDRGTDYVNRRIRERNERALPCVAEALELSQKLHGALAGCGLDESVRQHLELKALDLVSHLAYRQIKLKEALA